MHKILGLGDRMKRYERRDSHRALPFLPVVARLDGKCFRAFTEGLERPYDHRLSNLMMKTTRHLVKEMAAQIGYTQSDEITLIWRSGDAYSQGYLNGRFQKIASVASARASVYFNQHLASAIPEKAGAMPVFDCRTWSVPTKEEAANVLLWREGEALRDSVSMAAHQYFKQCQLHGRNLSEMKEMLTTRGVVWSEYPPFFKRGTFLQRRSRSRRFTQEEVSELPPLHHARQNPDLEVFRSVVVALDMPRFSEVRNRVAVIFEGEEPQVRGV